ncbi:MAG: hypothetical protein ACOCY0_03560 [Roseicyclus sp.]
MCRLRPILGSLLALALTVTSIGAASARGAMAADGVICGTGSFAVVIAADGLPLFDGGGTPVELDALPCLDCVFGMMALVAGLGLPAPAAMERRLGATRHATPAPRVWQMGGKGRGPPRSA